MIINKTFILIGVILAIVGTIYYLNSNNPGQTRTSSLDITKINSPKYQEIVNSSGYINVDKITIGELIGKKIILIDFWTYSCINCQRTSPILNAWYEKYKEKGLEIIGIHTPEFEFEKNIENVRKAVVKEKIKFPVVLDNDYSSWNAYGNRYWPRQYLIDLEGKIVLDHIGEFSKQAHGEFEQKIQELLKIKEAMTSPQVSNFDPTKPLSPETYLGSKKGAPSDNLSLIGNWDVELEYATNKTNGAKIVYKYMAKNVFLVASSVNGVKLKIMVDGKEVDKMAGEDVANGIVTVKEERLYNLIQDQSWGEHTLEIIIDSPGLKAYTFTFG